MRDRVSTGTGKVWCEVTPNGKNHDAWFREFDTSRGCRFCGIYKEDPAEHWAYHDVRPLEPYELTVLGLEGKRCD